MSHLVGVDVGATYSAAAVCRDGRVETATLGGRSIVVPSVVLLDWDGQLLVGDAAEHRALAEPDRLAREFKRRVCDSPPLMVGGAPFTADALMAKMVGWALEQIAQVERAPASGVPISPREEVTCLFGEADDIGHRDRACGGGFAGHGCELDDNGHRLVTRNGHAVNGPRLVALVRAGDVFEKGVLIERGGDERAA